MAKLCTVCKRREAVYKRTYSGDLLCKPCLRRQLTRQIKHSLGSQGILKPRQHVIVALSPLAPLQSLTLAEIATSIEAKYGSKVTILYNKNTIKINNNRMQRPPVDAVELIVADDMLPKEDMTYTECMRFERATAVIHAIQNGADAVILPYTRDMLAIAMLEATASDWTYLSEARDYLAGAKPAIAGLSRVESEAASAYAALSGYDAQPLCKPRMLLSKVFKRIARGRPELVYSTAKSIELLSTQAGVKARTCRICGGYTRQGDVCSICKMLTSSKTPE